MNIKGFLSDLGVKAYNSQQEQRARLEQLRKQETDMAVKGFVPDPQGPSTKLGSSLRRAFFYDPSMDVAPKYTSAKWHEGEVALSGQKTDLQGIRLKYNMMGANEKGLERLKQMDKKLDRVHDINLMNTEYKNDRNLQKFQIKHDNRFFEIEMALKEEELDQYTREGVWAAEEEKLNSMVRELEKDYVEANGPLINELKLRSEKAKAKKEEAEHKYIDAGVKQINLDVKNKKAELKEWTENKFHRDYMRQMERTHAYDETVKAADEAFARQYSKYEWTDSNGVTQVWAVNKRNPQVKHLMYKFKDANNVAQMNKAYADYLINMKIASGTDADKPYEGDDPIRGGDLSPDRSIIVPSREINAPPVNPVPTTNNNNGGASPSFNSSDRADPRRIDYRQGPTSSRGGQGLSQVAFNDLLRRRGPTRSMKNVPLNDNSVRRFS